MKTTRVSDRTGPRPPTRARRTGAPHAERGFTLAEVLIAATLGALLLVATASAASIFSNQFEDLKQDQDAALQETLTALTDEVRYAWWADVPDASTLVLADPAGSTTTWSFRQDKLVVQRPSGEQGTVLEGLTSGSFSAETMLRYREGAPAVRTGTFWSVAAPVAAVPQTRLLEAGDQLALGFTATSPAPVGQSLVAGIEEQLLCATPTTLTLSIAAVTPVSGTVRIDLFRARAPGDARPEGASLASLTLSPTALPVTPSYIVNTKNNKHISGPKHAKWGWWKFNPNLALVVTPPSSAVPVNISQLGQAIQPGCAYALQLQVIGAGGIAVAVTPAASASGSGVAFASASGGGMQQAALGCERSLDGSLTVTQALATAVTNRVHVALTGGDGTGIAGSATLTGQGMADDAWLGVVPGETEP